jgi:pimeloyl-ACP methyl ester carboxylesterase
MKTVYCIKGLGATDEVFDYIVLPDGYQKQIVQWERPDMEENVSQYVVKLLPQIQDPQPILMGLSLGGMVAVELSTHFEKCKLIIISSIIHQDEMPFTIKTGRYIGNIGRKLVINAMKSPIVHKIAIHLYKKKFGEMVVNMMKQQDLYFNEWVIKHIVWWKTNANPQDICRIHGNRDLMFPSIFIGDYKKVKGGTHFMIVEQAEEVNEFIGEYLKGGKVVDPESFLEVGWLKEKS